MKIVIGIIVVLGLAWLLIGNSADEAVTPEAPATEEVMEEGTVTEEGDAMMIEGADHGDEMVVEEGAMMEEDGAMMEEDGAMVEEEPAQ